LRHPASTAVRAGPAGAGECRTYGDG
jgi:hypothetical protein